MIGIICEDSRKCFAKQTGLNGEKRCKILSGGYPGNKCPFCKPPEAVKKAMKKEEQQVRMRKRNAAARKLEKEST